MFSNRFNCSVEILSSPRLKRSYNQALFTHIASIYPLATQLLSWRRDAAWKAKLISLLPILKQPVIVDLACGSGDLTSLLLKRYPDGSILGVDLTGAMLLQARKRVTSPRASFQIGDMDQLALKDESVDLISGGYALRNAPDLKNTLVEVYRILKPNGIAAFLDFSKSPSPLIQLVSLSLLKFWCSLWGIILHRDPNTYGYIVKSLLHFPDRIRMNALLNQQHFEVLVSRPVFFGFAQLTIVKKSVTTQEGPYELKVQHRTPA